MILNLPYEKEPVGCRWVFFMKLQFNGTIEQYKVRLVTNGYTQTNGVDYQKTFAPVAKVNFITILTFVAFN